MDMKAFTASCENAPRITSMADFFSKTAGGEANSPVRDAQADLRLLNDDNLTTFYHALKKNMGPFLHHYFASIPYSLEEECRLGSAIIQYSEKYSESLSLYCLGMAEGSMARTISQLSEGKIRTLTTSPTKTNEYYFYENGPVAGADFICTPFFRLPQHLECEHYKKFSAGFDIIIEDTTFQMYSPDRENQIQFVKQFLKEDGLFIFTEKFRCEPDEYVARENQKDISFKRRFFTEEQLDLKKRVILDRMSENEVSVDEMKMALDKHFRHKAIYWNSGNFHSIVASSSQHNIDRFLSLLGHACIPFEYVYCDLPMFL